MPQYTRHRTMYACPEPAQSRSGCEYFDTSVLVWFFSKRVPTEVSGIDGHVMHFEQFPTMDKMVTSTLWLKLREPVRFSCG